MPRIWFPGCLPCQHCIKGQHWDAMLGAGVTVPWQCLPVLCPDTRDTPGTPQSPAVPQSHSQGQMGQQEKNRGVSAMSPGNL